MACTKNIKKHWLWGTYNGPHNLKGYMLNSFMPYGDSFVLHTMCELCGCKHTYNFLTHDELLEIGYTNEQISDASRSSWGIKV